MGRPRKSPDEKARKWSVLQATPSQRAEITAKAQEAGTSICAFILSACYKAQIVVRQDWQRIARRQVALHDLLEQIARTVEDRATPLDAAQILWELRDVERQVTDLVQSGVTPNEAPETDAPRLDAPAVTNGAVDPC